MTSIAIQPVIRPAKARKAYDRKTIGKVLRATARFYEENLERWTVGRWRAQFFGNGRYNENNLRHTIHANNWDDAQCYCAHGGVAKVAREMGLPNQSGQCDHHPHRQLVVALNAGGLTTDWNDVQKSPLPVIAKLREIARSYR